MRVTPLGRLVACAALLAAGAPACSDGTETSPRPGLDAGAGASAKPGQIQITASSEALGEGGFDFPPASRDAPFFVDGWRVDLDEVLVTVDRITIAEEPNKSLTDQSVTGKVVAEVNGPWALELHKRGPLVGKGGTDRAVPVTVVESQNKNGSAPFAEDQAYAFSYDVVPATASARRVNFDARAEADYAEMVQRGATLMLVGVAEHKGGTDCDPAADPVLAKLPRRVTFRLAFRTPATALNCQNPDNKGRALAGEDAQRGVYVKRNEPTTAQLTFHIDHPFWAANEEDAPLRFDAYAVAAYNRWLAAADAGAVSPDAGGAVAPAELPVTLDELVGVDFTSFKADGTAVPSRTCGPGKAPSPGPLAYDPKGETFADLAAFVSHLQASLAHLNADGLCALRRN
jgi:hypothetical protein